MRIVNWQEEREHDGRYRLTLAQRNARVEALRNYYANPDNNERTPFEGGCLTIVPIDSVQYGPTGRF